MGDFCFGVDIGGTTAKIGLFDLTGNILDKWAIPTRTENAGENILPDITKTILNKMKKRGLSKDEIVGVGAGAPGPVDEEGTIYKAPNLGWGIFSVRDTFSELLGLPVRAGNDANVAALGEMWRGGGQGYKNLVAVTLGTGVGGGIIVNGRILTGTRGSAGEIGHMHIEDEELEECGCGNRGCLEQYASATGMVRLIKRKLKESEVPSILREREIGAKTFWDAVKEEDRLAIEGAEQFGQYIGKGLACIAAVVDPQIFIIGGGVSKAGDIILSYIKKYYDMYAYNTNLNVKFELAKLGNDAGIYGAAKLVLEAYMKQKE